MPFYTSPCNPLRIDIDPNSQIYKKLIFLITTFEILIVIIAIIYSAIKNHQCKIMQRQKIQQKSIQTPIIESASHDLKTQVVPTSHSIFGGFKSGKSLNDKKIMYLESNCYDLPIVDQIALKQKVNKQKSVDSHKKNSENLKRQLQIENQSIQAHKNEKINDNKQQRQIKKCSTSLQKLSKEFSNTLRKNEFIEIGQLKLSKDIASIYFNTILGHFFIGAVLTMQISPQIVSVLFSGAHFIFFVILLLSNIFISDEGKQNRIKQRTQLEEKREETISIDFQVHQQNKNNKVKVKFQHNFCQIKRRINCGIIILMMLINLCLFSLAVIRIKESYFNVVQSKCA